MGSTRARTYSREMACMIHLDGAEYCIDPAGAILELLGRKWTLPLIGVLGNQRQSRFNEMADALKGVGSKVLADRLQGLQKLGMVSREVFPETPVRIEYSLTERGWSLRKALAPLLAWAAEGPPLGKGGR